jgi:hypothetical protein
MDTVLTFFSFSFFSGIHHNRSGAANRHQGGAQEGRGGKGPNTAHKSPGPAHCEGDEFELRSAPCDFRTNTTRVTEGHAPVSCGCANSNKANRAPTPTSSRVG